MHELKVKILCISGKYKEIDLLDIKSCYFTCSILSQDDSTIILLSEN